MGRPAASNPRARLVNLEREREALRRLEEALDWPSEQRDRRLSTELQHDPAMLQIVRELLTAATAANESLPTRLPIAAEIEDTPPPERIGPYRVGAMLGVGGMGRVFQGERADGLFDQTVAIKLMRRTVLSGLVADQFARERQILAKLRHRNIAQLFDGGVTPDGQSYFVMELVEGRSIVDDVRARALPLRERLQVFLQVCGAVQHAHAHLVVHADLKPSNVIVTPDGTAKLLDFGVARALADAQDQQHRPLGITYDYASPARRRGAAPTTIDDVYSLGVLLDELLTDVRDVPKDLRAVVARARSEGAERRYASVGAFADELRRWLAGGAVEAYSGGLAYPIGKLVRRHWLAASIGAGALLLLGIAAVALALLYVEAEQARRRAEQRFADAREVSRWVLYDVYDRLSALPKTLTLRRDIAESAQTYLNRLADDPSAPPAVRIEVAEGLRRLASVQGMPGAANLALAEAARANLERAAMLLAAVRPKDAEGVRALELQRARVAVARATLATASELDFAPAAAALDEADRRLARVLADAPGDREAAALRLESVIQRAALLQWQGKYADSIALAQHELGASRSALAAAPDDRGIVRRHARLLDIYAESIYFAGRPAEAVPAYEEQLALMRGLLAADPDDVRRIADYSRAGWALASTFLQIRRFHDGERAIREVLPSNVRLHALDPDDVNAARSLDIATGTLANALAGQKRFPEALALLEERLASMTARSDGAPNDWNLLRDRLVTLAMIGDVRADAGRVAEACRTYESFLSIVERLRAAGKWSQLDQDYSLRIVDERRHRHCGVPLAGAATVRPPSRTSDPTGAAAR
jgi:tetratricopeptide (TPR) repeat protein